MQCYYNEIIMHTVLLFLRQVKKITRERKIASLDMQEPQPTGTTKWVTIFRFGKILGTTSVVKSIQNREKCCQM